MEKSRYFMAVVLSGEALENAEKLKLKIHDQFGLTGALRSPAHITLHRPFEWKTEKESTLIRSLETFDFSCPFDVQLDGLGSFSERVIYIKVHPHDSLIQMHDALRRFARKELGLLNEWDDKRGFHPHVTIAFRDLRKRHFAEVWSAANAAQYSQPFTVRGLSLLRLEDKWRETRFFDLTKPGIYTGSK